MTTQENWVEAKKETNSMHEESPRVEQTRDMVAECLVGPSQQWTSPTDGERPS